MNRVPRDPHDEETRRILEAIQRDVGLLAEAMIGLRKDSRAATSGVAQLQTTLAEMKSLMLAMNDRR